MFFSHISSLFTENGPKSETAVKLIDLEDTSKVKHLEGHTAGVRWATWHPSGTLVVRVSYGPTHNITTDLVL